MPSQDLNRLVDEVAVTDKQRGKFLAIIQADKAIGSVDALRQAGVAGTAGQLRAWLKDEDELQRQARQARGWNLNRVEATAWQVATDTTHPSWDRANARILKAYHPAFRDQTKVDVAHTGADGGPIQVEDRSASLADVARVLEAAGALAQLGREPSRKPVPDAPPVLPALPPA